ncbi:hypothetical protein JXB01_02335 [Candidatus Micrarchaeota archaeon]|nr:hypothetical protein [Candidatus Micrarchaeota archaeon]
MHTGLIKKGGKTYIRLPDELSEFESLEVFKLREGYYLISAPPAKQKEKSGEKISEDEMSIIGRLMSIKFEKRNPAYISKMFTKKENEILGRMIKQKIVNVFYGRKYKKTGVYTISDRVFEAWKKHNTEKTKKPDRREENYSPLFSNGYMIFENEDEAKKVSEKFKILMQKKQIMGTRGFDEKFYIITQGFYLANMKILKTKLKEPSTIQEIAGAMNNSEEGALALFRVLCEKGEAIENRKDVFSLV